MTANPGVPAGVLAGRIRAALHGGRGYTIATGAARGDVANLNAAVERSDGQILGAALIPPIVMISLFVLAATTALAVNLRRRRFALLRTVGATRGQVRRAILAELAGCGLAGGLLGWLPGAALGGARRARAGRAPDAARRVGGLADSVAAAHRGRRQRARDRAERAGRGAPGQPDRARARRCGRPPPNASGRTRCGSCSAWPRRAGAGALVALTFGQKSPARPARAGVPAAAGVHGGGGAARPAAGGRGRLAGPAVPGGRRPVGPAGAGRDRGAAAPYRLRGHPGGPGRRHGGLRLLRRLIDRARHRHPGREHRDGRPGDLQRQRPGPTGTLRQRPGSCPGVRAAAGVAPVALAVSRPGPGVRRRRGRRRRPARPASSTSA